MTSYENIPKCQPRIVRINLTRTRKKYCVFIPGAHFVHDVCPVVELNVPASHGTGSTVGSLHMYPAGHTVHMADLAADAYHPR